ncbi:hypothetical protein ACOME3_008633 [Neoechinorhynchus agilis]
MKAIHCHILRNASKFICFSDKSIRADRLMEFEQTLRTRILEYLVSQTVSDLVAASLCLQTESVIEPLAVEVTTQDKDIQVGTRNDVTPSTAVIAKLICSAQITKPNSELANFYKIEYGPQTSRQLEYANSSRRRITIFSPGGPDSHYFRSLDEDEDSPVIRTSLNLYSKSQRLRMMSQVANKLHVEMLYPDSGNDAGNSSAVNQLSRKSSENLNNNFLDMFPPTKKSI